MHRLKKQSTIDEGYNARDKPLSACPRTLS